MISLNVRGRRSSTKRQAIFNYVKNRADIAILTETHTTSSDELIWSAEYGGKILFSHGETNARGVMILFKKGINVNIISYSRDIDGRIMNCIIEWNNQRINICGIYAPNNDSPSFLSKYSKLQLVRPNKQLYSGITI